jgi:hypothetical protein
VIALHLDTFYTRRSVRRERLAWLVTLPIAIVGCEFAHAFSNIVFGAPDSGRAELFQGGPGASAVPLLAGLAIVAVLLGLAGRFTGAWTASHARAARLPFALLGPALYVVQEHIETVLRTGAAPVGTLLEPGFLPGLVLQIPFALAAYAIARALIRLADGVRALVASRRRVPRRAGASAPHRPVLAAPPRSEAHRWAYSGRAPPPLTTAPA